MKMNVVEYVKGKRGYVRNQKGKSRTDLVQHFRLYLRLKELRSVVGESVALRQAAEHSVGHPSRAVLHVIPPEFLQASCALARPFYSPVRVSEVVQSRN